MKKEVILNCAKKIFDKSSYLIEYILSLFLIIDIFLIASTKSASGYISMNNLICAIILGILTLAMIIYIGIKNKKCVEKLFITFAIPISIAYAIFILPLNIPDEGTHMLKAYDLSLGYLFPRIDENGESYCTVVKELENYSYLRIQEYADVQTELIKETNYEETINLPCAAQTYCPLLYTAQVTSIVICRMIGINIFYALYLGRLLNGIIFLVLGYFAIKKLCFGKLLLAIYLCMPMMMQQAASCSADAVLNITIIYYIVFLINLVFKKEKITSKEKIILYILTALIGMFKYIYILIAGIFFITIFSKKEERKEYLKTAIIMILVGSIFTIGWFVISSRFSSTPEAMRVYYELLNVDSGKQIKYIIENPLSFLKIMTREYLVFGSKYLFEAVGSCLGWLEVNVGMGVIVGYIIILIITAISEENNYEFKIKSKVWLITLILAISFILKVTMYIAFSPVGWVQVAGVQGRYFTPILFLAIICLVKKNNNWKVSNLQEKMLIMSTVLNISVLSTVIINYL